MSLFTFLRSIHSHRTQAKIFFDICRLFFDLFLLVLRSSDFRLVWIGPYSSFKRILHKCKETSNGNFSSIEPIATDRIERGSDRLTEWPSLQHTFTKRTLSVTKLFVWNIQNYKSYNDKKARTIKYDKNWYEKCMKNMFFLALSKKVHNTVKYLQDARVFRLCSNQAKANAKTTFFNLSPSLLSISLSLPISLGVNRPLGLQNDLKNWTRRRSSLRKLR